MKQILPYVASLVLCLSAAGVEAKPPVDSNAPKAGIGADSGDPNRIICRTEQETGSRLRGRRVCLKASDWADRNAQNRQLIERAQNSKWSHE